MIGHWLGLKLNEYSMWCMIWVGNGHFRVLEMACTFEIGRKLMRFWRSGIRIIFLQRWNEWSYIVDGRKSLCVMLFFSSYFLWHCISLFEVQLEFEWPRPALKADQCDQKWKETGAYLNVIRRKWFALLSCFSAHSLPSRYVMFSRREDMRVGEGLGSVYGLSRSMVLRASQARVSALPLWWLSWQRQSLFIRRRMSISVSAAQWRHHCHSDHVVCHVAGQ